jgi:hypothetical protein
MSIALQEYFQETAVFHFVVGYENWAHPYRLPDIPSPFAGLPSKVYVCGYALSIKIISRRYIQMRSGARRNIAVHGAAGTHPEDKRMR